MAPWRVFGGGSTFILKKIVIYRLFGLIRMKFSLKKCSNGLVCLDSSLTDPLNSQLMPSKLHEPIFALSRLNLSLKNLNSNSSLHHKNAKLCHSHYIIYDPQTLPKILQKNYAIPKPLKQKPNPITPNKRKKKNPQENIKIVTLCKQYNCRRILPLISIFFCLKMFFYCTWEKIYESFARYL